MLRVGLTGGMGSGKSTVAKIFSVLGAPVYDADAAAKRLMQNDEGLKEKLVGVFGDELFKNGELDRAWLAAKVFKEAALLSKLNALVHPATIKDGAEWMISQHFPYAIKEAALIFESGSDKELDFVIGVRSPLKLRISRIKKRDATSEESILARMEKQMPENEKMSLCDAIIENDEKHLLIPQVLQLHRQFLNK